MGKNSSIRLKHKKFEASVMSKSIVNRIINLFWGFLVVFGLIGLLRAVGYFIEKLHVSGFFQ